MKSLLNSRRQQYFVEKKKRHLEDGNIFDESGNVIGLIKKRKKILSILEPDGQLSFLINEGTFLKPNYEIEDSNGNYLSKIEFKRVVRNNQKVSMKNNEGNKILETESSDSWAFRIKDRSGKNVAKVDLYFDMPEGNFDVSNLYGLEIKDFSFNKMSLIGFFLVLVSALKKDFYEYIQPMP